MHNALIFGYGQKDDGNIDEQTEDRCKKAVRMYERGLIDKIYITVWIGKNGVGMADAMSHYLTSRGVPESSIVTKRRGKNIAGELDIFLSLVSRERKLLLISTWYHIPRIIYLALWRLRWSQFTTAIAWRHAHFVGDILMEIPKLVNAILRPIRSSKT